MLNLHGAKNYIKDQFCNNNDSRWLEGWICGYTDGDHNYKKNIEIRETLLNYMDKLKTLKGETP